MARLNFGLGPLVVPFTSNLHDFGIRRRKIFANNIEEEKKNVKRSF